MNWNQILALALKIATIAIQDGPGIIAAVQKAINDFLIANGKTPVAFPHVATGPQYAATMKPADHELDTAFKEYALAVQAGRASD